MITSWLALTAGALVTTGAQVVPFYSHTTGKRERPAIGLSRMLRMYVVLQCFGFSDEGTEDAVYDSQAIRGFISIDLGRESALDSTTLLRFRRSMETHYLASQVFCSKKALSSTLSCFPCHPRSINIKANVILRCIGLKKGNQCNFEMRPTLYRRNVGAGTQLGRYGRQRGRHLLSRASYPGDQGAFQSPKGSLPWNGKENGAGVQAVWVGQSDFGQRYLQRAAG